jgi:ABC-type lipoprotein export system ATPase subunit
MYEPLFMPLIFLILLLLLLLLLLNVVFFSAGEVVAVMGRSGIGKSRLLRALAGLDPASLLNSQGAVKLVVTSRHQKQERRQQHQPQAAEKDQDDDEEESVRGEDGVKQEDVMYVVSLPLTRSFGMGLEMRPASWFGGGVGGGGGWSGGGHGGSGASAMTGNGLLPLPSLPWWRSVVCYVPQDVPALLGSPLDLLTECTAYDHHHCHHHHHGSLLLPPPARQHTVDGSSSWKETSGHRLALPTKPPINEPWLVVDVGGEEEGNKEETGVQLTEAAAGSTATVQTAPPTTQPTPLAMSKTTAKTATAELHRIGSAMGLRRGCVEQPWRDLSGGERQRSLLAVALALGNAKVLLLDEPTSAADVHTTRAVETCLASFNLAVVWVTHDEVQAARVASRILRLDSGIGDVQRP